MANNRQHNQIITAQAYKLFFDLNLGETTNIIDLLKFYSVLSEGTTLDIDEKRQVIVVYKNKQKLARIEIYDEQIFQMLIPFLKR
jgi:hypothetical protein